MNHYDIYQIDAYYAAFIFYKLDIVCVIPGRLLQRNITTFPVASENDKKKYRVDISEIFLLFNPLF